jgi:hypothetical protein
MGVLYILGAVMTLSIGYVLAMRALRRFAMRGQNVPPQPGFDMAELQSMLEKGLISFEEFERLKLLTMEQRAQADAAKKLTGFQVIPLAKPHEPEGK